MIKKMAGAGAVAQRVGWLACTLGRMIPECIARNNYF